MAYSILGQAAPAAATITELYVVPATTETVVSTLKICNFGDAATEIRVAVNIAGAAVTDAAYIYYDLVIPANETFSLTEGLTLATTDQIEVYCTLATVSFNLFGNEVDLS